MHISDNFFLDNEGRTLILRGVNLGGDSKVPFCAPGIENEPDFLNRQNKVSFVGRPFPIEEAESHFKRLKNAGMTFLRFLVTWEAIEHEGPGIYDEEYLAYLRKILLAADKEGISVFIDPHQDVWSRWTGGDGAPAWTMEMLGMNLDNCDACGAAITKQRYTICTGKPYKKMVWPSNYDRYASATMFSLFFAGKAYAADLQVEGENVQDWLQNHYIAAFKHAQRRLKNLAAIKGWGSMNEPHQGFIAHKNLEKSEEVMIPIGARPSPWQSICAASGFTEKVPVYSFISAGKLISNYEIINPQKVSLFKNGFSCPWKLAGVWTDEGGAPKLLKKDHFSHYNGRRVDFADDFLKPFIVKHINALKEADEKTFFFIEGLAFSRKAESHPSWNDDDHPRTVNAFHWYDGLSLYTKSFRPWFNIDQLGKRVLFGEKKITAFYAECLTQGIRITKQKMKNMPCFVGEFGLAFDTNNKIGFKTGDYSLHEKALSMFYDAVDYNLLNSTIWNYSATNTNKYGDSWNEEDLSIFSEGKERAAAGWKRPYPMATAGKPLFFNWNRKRGEFVFRFTADKNIAAPGIIYLPAETFGMSPKIETHKQTGESLRHEYQHEEQRLLIYNDDYSGEAELKVRLN